MDRRDSNSAGQDGQRSTSFAERLLHRFRSSSLGAALGLSPTVTPVSAFSSPSSPAADVASPGLVEPAPVAVDPASVTKQTPRKQLDDAYEALCDFYGENEKTLLSFLKNSKDSTAASSDDSDVDQAATSSIPDFKTIDGIARELIQKFNAIGQICTKENITLEDGQTLRKDSMFKIVRDVKQKISPPTKTDVLPDASPAEGRDDVFSASPDNSAPEAAPAFSAGSSTGFSSSSENEDAEVDPETQAKNALQKDLNYLLIDRLAKHFFAGFLEGRLIPKSRAENHVADFMKDVSGPLDTINRTFDNHPNFQYDQGTKDLWLVPGRAIVEVIGTTIAKLVDSTVTGALRRVVFAKDAIQKAAKDIVINHPLYKQDESIRAFFDEIGFMLDEPQAAAAAPRATSGRLLPATSTRLLPRAPTVGLPAAADPLVPVLPEAAAEQPVDVHALAMEGMRQQYESLSRAHYLNDEDADRSETLAAVAQNYLEEMRSALDEYKTNSIFSDNIRAHWTTGLSSDEAKLKLQTGSERVENAKKQFEHFLNEPSNAGVVSSSAAYSQFLKLSRNWKLCTSTLNSILGLPKPESVAILSRLDKELNDDEHTADFDTVLNRYIASVRPAAEAVAALPAAATVEPVAAVLPVDHELERLEQAVRDATAAVNVDLAELTRVKIVAKNVTAVKSAGPSKVSADFSSAVFSSGKGKQEHPLVAAATLKLQKSRTHLKDRQAELNAYKQAQPASAVAVPEAAFTIAAVDTSEASVAGEGEQVAHSMRVTPTLIRDVGGAVAESGPEAAADMPSEGSTLPAAAADAQSIVLRTPEENTTLIDDLSEKIADDAWHFFCGTKLPTSDSEEDVKTFLGEFQANLNQLRECFNRPGFTDVQQDSLRNSAVLVQKVVLVLRSLLDSKVNINAEAIKLHLDRSVSNLSPASKDLWFIQWLQRNPIGVQLDASAELSEDEPALDDDYSSSAASDSDVAEEYETASEPEPEDYQEDSELDSADESVPAPLVKQPVIVPTPAPAPVTTMPKPVRVPNQVIARRTSEAMKTANGVQVLANKQAVLTALADLRNECDAVAKGTKLPKSSHSNSLASFFQEFENKAEAIRRKVTQISNNDQSLRDAVTESLKLVENLFTNYIQRLNAINPPLTREQMKTLVIAAAKTKNPALHIAQHAPQAVVVTQPLAPALAARPETPVAAVSIEVPAPTAPAPTASNASAVPPPATGAPVEPLDELAKAIYNLTHHPKARTPMQVPDAMPKRPAATQPGANQPIGDTAPSAAAVPPPAPRSGDLAAQLVQLRETLANQAGARPVMDAIENALPQAAHQADSAAPNIVQVVEAEAQPEASSEGKSPSKLRAFFSAVWNGLKALGAMLFGWIPKLYARIVGKKAQDVDAAEANTVEDNTVHPGFTSTVDNTKDKQRVSPVTVDRTADVPQSDVAAKEGKKMTSARPTATRAGDSAAE